MQKSCLARQANSGASSLKSWSIHSHDKHRQGPHLSIRIVIWILPSDISIPGICQPNKNISKYWDGNAIYRATQLIDNWSWVSQIARYCRSGRWATRPATDWTPHWTPPSVQRTAIVWRSKNLPQNAGTRVDCTNAASGGMLPFATSAGIRFT